MSRTYRFSLRGDPHGKLQLLQTKAAQSGVQFVGDVERGTFSGRGLSGSYVRQEDDFVVTIESVPFLFTFDSVATMIGKFLEE